MKPAGKPCFDCLDEAIAVDQPRLAAPRQVAFWFIAYVFAATMLGTTLPTPLYVIWQSQWHFSSGLVTLIFAVYAAGVLAALVFAGRASDQVGRRSVLGAALAFSALSTVVFIIATSVGWLFLGRVLSGFSAGLMTGTATAALTDMLGLAKPRRASLVSTVANTFGLGLGPLLAGLFAQYLPRPTVLVFEVYLVLLAAAALAVAWVPETVQHRQRLSIRFAGFGFPSSGTDEFLAAGVAGFAAFSLLGIFERARTDVPRRRLASTQPRRRRRSRVHDLRNFGCHSGRRRALRLPEGRLVRTGPIPVRPGPHRRRVVAGVIGPLSRWYRRRRGRGRLRFHRQSLHRQPPRPRRAEGTGGLLLFCVLLSGPCGPCHRSWHRLRAGRHLPVGSRLLNRARRSVCRLIGCVPIGQGAGTTRKAGSRPSWPHRPEYQGWLGPPRRGGVTDRIRTFASYIIFTTMSRTPPGWRGNSEATERSLLRRRSRSVGHWCGSK